MWQRYAGVLAEVEFRRLFLGQAVSALGDRVAPVALAFAVLDLTGSAAALGVVLAAQTLPLAAFVLVGGVWADRLPRRLVLLASDVVRLVAQGLTALLLVTGTARLWQLVVLQTCYGAAEAFFRPAMHAVIPEVVSSGRLQQANALVALSYNVAMVVGPPIAAVVVAVTSPGAAIAVDAASFAVSAAFLLRLRPVPRSAPAAREPFWRELRSGMSTVFRTRWMASVIGGFTFYHALVMPGIFVLGPALMKRDYAGASSYAVTVAGFGVGAIAGGAVALRVKPRRPIAVCAALLAVGACQPLVYSSGAEVAAIAGSLAIPGAAVAYLFTVWDTTVQQQVPPQLLARVVSIDYFGSTALMPLGMIVVGPLGEAVGLEVTLRWLSGVGVTLALVPLLVPQVRELRRDTPPPAPVRVAGDVPATP